MDAAVTPVQNSTMPPSSGSALSNAPNMSATMAATATKGTTVQSVPAAAQATPAA